MNGVLAANNQSDLEISLESVVSLIAILSQFVLALLIVFVMIAVTHREEFEQAMGEAKEKVGGLMDELQGLRASDVGKEREKYQVALNEKQKLVLLRVLDEIERRGRNKLLLSVFLRKDDEDKLAVYIINKVGTIGTFIGDWHTLNHIWQ